MAALEYPLLEGGLATLPGLDKQLSKGSKAG